MKIKMRALCEACSNCTITKDTQFKCEVTNVVMSKDNLKCGCTDYTAIDELSVSSARSC